jgi:hypothetical protein
MIIDDPPGAEVAAIPIEQIPEQFRGLVAAFTDPESLMNRAFALSTPDIDFNSPEAQAAEIPSSNGICTADGLARLYAALIGEVDGVRILDAASLAGAIVEQAAGPDRVLLVPSRFASGYMLPTEESPLGGPGSFGHPGRGGALGFGDPETSRFQLVSPIRQDGRQQCGTARAGRGAAPGWAPRLAAADEVPGRAGPWEHDVHSPFPCCGPGRLRGPGHPGSGRGMVTVDMTRPP